MTTANEPADRNAEARKANRRLAIALGLVAVAFYLLMLFFSP